MATVPTTEKRPKVFYGWWVLTVTVIVSFFGAILTQVFTGSLLPTIAADTGWSRASITFAVTLGGITSGFAAPLFGKLADKYGPRVLTSIGLLGTTVAVFLLAWSHSLGVGMFFVGFVAGRIITQNIFGGVVSRTTMVNWFRRMRGRAMGISQMSGALGTAALVALAQVLLRNGYTWQQVYVGCGVLMLLILAPLAYLVLRRRPEDMGFLPDGGEPVAKPVPNGKKPKQAKILEPEYNWSLKQAMHTRALWLLIAGMGVGTIANGAISFHMTAYFHDVGLSALVAATALTTYALSGSLANGLWGFLVEHISERVIGTVSVLFAAVVTFSLLFVHTPAQAIIAAGLFGLAARGETSIIMMIQAQYYGRRSFGTISGFTTPFQQIGLGLGPSIAVIPYSFTGSYRLAFVAFAVIYLIAAFLIWIARKPSPPPELLAKGPIKG